MNKQIQPLGWLGLAGCGAAIAGSFMPWVSIDSVFGTIDIRGTEGDGKLTALIAVAAGLLALVGLVNGTRANVTGGGGLCLIGIAFSVYELQHISSQTGGLSGALHVSVGIGVWLMLVGFIVGAVCLFKAAPDPLDAYT